MKKLIPIAVAGVVAVVPAYAHLTSNSITHNSLTHNSITHNALSANGVSNHRAEMSVTGHDIRAVTLRSGRRVTLR